MTGPNQEGKWNFKTIGPRWPWSRGILRPADISEGLISTMLERGNWLEDVSYTKIVPNHFIVEVNAQNYAVNYRPIEEHIVQQWSDRLISHLMTTNSRYGRKEFRFAGPVQVELRPVPDLPSNQVRILAQIARDASASRVEGEEGQPEIAPRARACLELPSGSQRWSLEPGTLVLGRDAGCDIVFNDPEIRSRRLVSGRHAYLKIEAGRFVLFDGSPDGKPSLNGTFLNGRRVTQSGALLQDGDTIILASEDPNRPRVDTPGVVTLIFRRDCA